MQRKARFHNLALKALIRMASLVILSGICIAEIANAKEETMQVIIEFDNQKVLIELEENATSKAFVEMLPLELEWSDFANKEKITYLPSKLQAKGDSSYIPQIGDFFCYAPWGNVGIFYEKQPPNSGLVFMGKVKNGLGILKSQNKPFKTQVYLTQ
ncbi:cyclophilin-like fold protein [Helicobacter sp. MIT 05-5294]|uniref:cyclophilin-like fold protein n=1 Tax=Helicobacter sp. MIT 05-5294 TaxID=1548150 RepID=UPI000A9C26A7|nr:cyclophilin-like fold protein [Helicobacter sp. MIT 05-5294]TLD86198.1 hypothetical protein LS69_006815 [Helicobacter sp. MIT 05-5294]